MTARAEDSGVRTGFSSLSTAVKMLIYLAAALLPLGLVAVLASIDAARDGRADRALAAQNRAEGAALHLEAAITRDLVALSMAAAAAATPSNREAPCALLRQAARSQPRLLLGGFTVFDRDGRQLCGSRNDRADFDRAPGTRIVLGEAGRGLLYSVRVPNGAASAALGPAALRAIAAAPDTGLNMNIVLRSGTRELKLLEGYSAGLFQRTIVHRARLAGSDLYAVVSVGAIPISAVEIASILLPLLMWLAAAMLGWLIVDRLLLRPIVKMQKAVLAYRPGGNPLVLPALMTPATEILDLGNAFRRVTDTVAVHEAELEAAIARQARLVREVHHRVKNNLQVVASLLNLHARGAKSIDAAEAYASIQRRVDALAVVHRNHFAELDDDRGVALRTLLSELTGNLRATAPDEAVGMSITLDLDPVHVNQDVAVSVAFFVTEVVEHAMLCTPNEPVGVSLTQSPSPLSARLKLSSASLKADAVCEGVDVRQFERITTGLSRQLRAVLERDTENGAFSIDIAVQPTPG